MYFIIVIFKPYIPCSVLGDSLSRITVINMFRWGISYYN